MSLLEEPKNDPSDVDPNKNYLEELVGEGRKFKSPEELAKGKYQSDKYVDILLKKLDATNAENQRLHTEYNSRAKLEELIDQLENRKTDHQQTPPVDDYTKPSLKLEDVEGLFSKKFQEAKITEMKEQNYLSVQKQMAEKWGPNYVPTLKSQMDELGLTEDILNELARTQPKLLIRTLGLDQTQAPDNFQAPMRSAQRNDPFAPKVTKRTWSYYQNMRKTNPSQYNDPKTTVQMHKDLGELGEAFKDGDFYN